MKTNPPLRVYLRVGKADKDTVKSLGAWWDEQARRWYVPRHVNPSVFAQWLPKTPPPPPRSEGTKAIATANLVVPKVIPFEASVMPAWKRSLQSIRNKGRK